MGNSFTNTVKSLALIVVAGVFVLGGTAYAATAGAGRLAVLLGGFAIVTLLGVALWLALSRMKTASVFNRLFIIVATTSALFSGVSSAIGFSLITSQENEDFLRNALLPPAFGLFVFFLAVAIWVGGAELVRHRDWFRKVGDGPLADGLFFFERAVKMFIVIPVLATILFFVSTWTTVVGIGGVDAVRFTYGGEVTRFQAECENISTWRQRDLLFLEDLRLSVADVSRAARNEREGGASTGAAGRGVVSDYFDGVAEWLTNLEASATAIVDAEDPSGRDPLAPKVCEGMAGDLAARLSRNAFENYDLWSREFETTFDDYIGVINQWRRDRRVERLLETQLANFDRANPKPYSADTRLSSAQREAIDRYAEDVEKALKRVLSKQKRAKPTRPRKSAAEISPERGLDIIYRIFVPREEVVEEPPRRTQSVVEAEFIPALSTITPRDAVLKNANIFSDVWALAIAWDYASYILMLAYLFFPSAERAANFKD